MRTTPLELDAAGEVQSPSEPSQVQSGPSSGRYLPGALLSGKYRLDALLGEGGMGAVWRASNLLLDMPVAIKLIRADLDRGSLRARLQLEARSAARLGHPAIVRIFDVGESEFGDPFIVMELLQGQTLARLITNGRLSATYAVQLLLPIIDALGSAHARGIVHRDLKPDNLMIAVEDQHIQPKILDFGIAKLTDPKVTDHKLTEAGAVVGSPDYMSPEQARGLEDLDASTDIWSSCVVLYEAITGCAPFSASNYHALLRAIVEDQPTSILERAAGDEALWAIIQRGLAKDRRQRFASMLELGRALAVWLSSHGVREDAAGTSIESKWLSRSSEALDASVATSSSSASDANALAPGSHSGATGFERGPFSRTVLPRVPTRKRVLGTLAGVSALLAVLAASVALALRPTASQPAAASRPVAVESRLNSALTAPEPALVPTPALSATPATQVTPVVSATAQPPAPALEPPSAAAAPHSSVRAAPVASISATHALPKSASATPTPANKGAAVVTPSVPASAANKSAERPLDLLAPY